MENALRIIILIISGVILILMLYNKQKYKKYCQKMVAENSDALKQLEEINSRYHFYNIHNYNRYIRYKVENKKYYYLLNAENVAIDYFINNYDYLINDIENTINNQILYQEYMNDVSNITKGIDESLLKSLNIKRKKFEEIEENIFKNNIYNINLNLTFTVKFVYTSKKGRVRLRRVDTLNCDDLLAIREKANKKNVYKKNYNLERSKMTDSLRYDVLKRDNFRCCLCGVSASDGAVLHVDHIKPVSKGGKTEYNNLQTLCDRCNLGKSNKY